MPQQNLNRVTRNKEALLGIGFMLCMIIPHTNTFFLLFGPLFCLLFYLSLSERRGVLPITWAVVFPMSLSLLINMTEPITSKGILSFVSILLILLVFPNVGNYRIRNIYIYITFSIIFVSQLAYLINVPLIPQLLDRLYPTDSNEIEHMADTITYSTAYDYRLGGLYRNANDCARSLNMLLAIFLIGNKKRGLKKNVYFVSLLFAAVLLTGSRTGFAIAFLLLFFSIVKNISLKSVIIAVPVFILGYYMFSSGSDSFRGLNVQEGFGNSAGPKWLFFSHYLEHSSSTIKLIIGNFDVAKYHAYNGIFPDYFDSDYGNIVYCYGFVGLVCFVYFFCSIYKQLKTEYRSFYILFLWVISNSVVFSYRMFFIYMIVLSMYYSASKARVVTSSK